MDLCCACVICCLSVLSVLLLILSQDTLVEDMLNLNEALSWFNKGMIIK